MTDLEYLDILKKRMARLVEERCDCVFSMQGATQCLRCREIQWTASDIKELENGNVILEKRQ